MTVIVATNFEEFIDNCVSHPEASIVPDDNGNLLFTTGKSKAAKNIKFAASNFFKGVFGISNNKNAKGYEVAQILRRWRDESAPHTLTFKFGRENIARTSGGNAPLTKNVKQRVQLAKGNSIHVLESVRKVRAWELRVEALDRGFGKNERWGSFTGQRNGSALSLQEVVAGFNDKYIFSDHFAESMDPHEEFFTQNHSPSHSESSSVNGDVDDSTYDMVDDIVDTSADASATADPQQSIVADVHYDDVVVSKPKDADAVSIDSLSSTEESSQVSEVKTWQQTKNEMYQAESTRYADLLKSNFVGLVEILDELDTIIPKDEDDLTRQVMSINSRVKNIQQSTQKAFEVINTIDAAYKADVEEMGVDEKKEYISFAKGIYETVQMVVTGKAAKETAIKKKIDLLYKEQTKKAALKELKTFEAVQPATLAPVASAATPLTNATETPDIEELAIKQSFDAIDSKITFARELVDRIQTRIATFNRGEITSAGFATMINGFRVDKASFVTETVALIDRVEKELEEFKKTHPDAKVFIAKTATSIDEARDDVRIQSLALDKAINRAITEYTSKESVRIQPGVTILN